MHEKLHTTNIKILSGDPKTTKFRRQLFQLFQNLAEFNLWLRPDKIWEFVNARLCYSATLICRIEHFLNACLEQLKISENAPEFAERFVLGSTSPDAHIRAVVLMFGDLVYEAELKVLRSNSIPYHSVIRDNAGSPYKLQQIQDCFNYAFKSINLIKAARLSGILEDPNAQREFYHDLFRLIRDARDCLTQPPRKTIDEHMTNPNRRCFHPPIPKDLVLSIFIRGCSLVFAAYTLSYNGSDKRWEIVSRSSADCVVPRLQETLFYLNSAMNTLTHLINKDVSLF